jgi:hypothetical protein
VEGNYYANYFSDLCGLVGVSYGDFGALRGLTRDFAEVFGKRKMQRRVGAGTHISKSRCGAHGTRLNDKQEGRSSGVLWEKGVEG